MIFSTVNNELAIFGSTIDEIKKKWNEFVKNVKIGNLFGEDGAFASLFSNKKEKSTLTPEVLSQFDEFKEKFNTSSLSAEALAEQMENIDERIIDYAKTCKNGEMTTEGFRASLNTMSFSAKAATIAFQALATALNMAAMFAITKGIELAATAISNYINRVEIAKEKMDNSVSSYESVKSELESISSELKTQGERIDELNAKDHLTYAEKGELERLQEITKELTMQQALKEKELESNAKQAADDTVDAYKKEFGKYELSDTRVKNEKDYIDYSGVITDFYAPDLAGQIAVYEELISKQ